MLQKIQIRKTPPTFIRQGSYINRQQPIFPGRLQPSIFGTNELNFCVRDGNRCGLTVITTGMVESLIPSGLQRKLISSGSNELLKNPLKNVSWKKDLKLHNLVWSSLRSLVPVSWMALTTYTPGLSTGSLPVTLSKEGNLISGLVSHLDAFSVYPIQT